MVELKIVLPYCHSRFRIAGVYQITFDDGFFYIGCSEHVRRRSSDWVGIMSNPEKKRGPYAIGDGMIRRIRDGGVAVFEILELCYPEEIKDREAFYLNKNKGNALMLSVADCAWKPVLQFKEDGHFIKKHDSIKAAARFMNCRIGRIQRVLNSERASYKGMVFVYETDYSERRRDIIRQRSIAPKKTKSIKVRQLDLNGELVAVHTTYRQAAAAVGGDARNIRRAITKEQLTACGYKWELASPNQELI